MATNKIVLREVSQFMADYQPIYSPLYADLLPSSQAHSEEVGKLDFKRLEAVGDIRGKHYTPKDTHIHQIAVRQGVKTFKKYFIPSQYVHSSLQDREGYEDVVKQVLDEHQVQMDELVLMGGTDGSTLLNNALYMSNDPNYTMEGSTDIVHTSPLDSMHQKVMLSVHKAEQIAGRKLIIFFGDDVLPSYFSLYSASGRSWGDSLKSVLDNTRSQYSLTTMPSAVTPSGDSGWLIVNLDQVKLHYTTLPKLYSQGVNSEKLYTWSNFLSGSTMVDVLAKNAIIHQPAALTS